MAVRAVPTTKMSRWVMEISPVGKSMSVTPELCRLLGEGGVEAGTGICNLGALPKGGRSQVQRYKASISTA
jgi:hypothetical protein